MPDGKKPLHIDTLAAQAGLKVRVGDTISTAPPIDPSTTFTYETVGQVHKALEPDGEGFAYARNGNPTVVVLEQAMEALESAESVVALGSGMAAVHATLTALQLWPGDVVLCSGDVYGVTRSLLAQMAQYEIETRYVDVFDLGGVDQALTDTRAKALYFETISNPLLRVPDAERLIEIASRHGAATVVDNTFATPMLFRPLEVGATVVVESATKYIAGHGDVIAGLVATDRSLGRRVRDARTVAGAVMSPFESWLTLRGIRTLPLRLERQCSSALALAQWLDLQEWVDRVHYPGLEHHDQHSVAHRQFGGRFGGMVAFDLRADRESVVRFMDSLDLVTPGTSLGDVESLVLYPPLSSHRTLSEEQRRDAGIGDGLVRMSVGVEHPDDLIADLAHAACAAGLAPR